MNLLPQKFALLLLTSLLWGCADIHAQNQPRNDAYGQWFMYFGDNRINERFGIHSEAQFRNYFLKGTVEQTLIRVGLNWYVDPLVMVSAGYGFIYTEPSSDVETGLTLREHRSWQQLIFRHRTRSIFMEHRYRLEQRFIDNLSRGTSEFDNRIRYRFQAILPLYIITPHLRHYFIASYNELFMNLGREVSGQFFDRNRLYFSIGYQVSPKLNFQVGYLNQVISLPGVENPDVNHNLQVALFFNMDDIMQTFFKRE